MIATNVVGEFAAPRSGARGVRITGVGVDIPPTVVTTAELEELARLRDFGIEAGWLERVTGVHERHWAEPHVRPSDLAAQAGRQALADARVDPATVDAVLFTGITKDFFEPATANVVAAAVGAHHARVLDLMNACNGFIEGIDAADSMIRCGKARRVLVTTGERVSLVNNFDVRTLEELVRSLAGFMLGDGGGALVLEATDEPDAGIQARELRSDPTQWPLAIGGRIRPTTEACECCGSVVDRRFQADGRRLLEVGLSMLPPVVGAVMERTGWRYEELDLIFCHEAHRRFVESAVEALGRSDVASRLWSTVARFGNTSTVSLPLAMAEATAAGVLVPGGKVLLVAGASGMSMAAMTVVW